MRKEKPNLRVFIVVTLATPHIILGIIAFLRFMKGCTNGGIKEALKQIKSTMNCKLMEVSQNDQYKKFSVFLQSKRW